MQSVCNSTQKPNCSGLSSLYGFQSSVSNEADAEKKMFDDCFIMVKAQISLSDSVSEGKA